MKAAYGRGGGGYQHSFTKEEAGLATHNKDDERVAQVDAAGGGVAGQAENDEGEDELGEAKIVEPRRVVGNMVSTSRAVVFHVGKVEAIFG